MGAFTLLAANYLVVRFLFKHRRLDQLVEGKSTTLIDRGKIQHKNLAKELLSHSELLTVGAPPGKFRLKNLSGVDLTAITACYYSISAPYAVRAYAGAPVATPLAWREVTPKLTPEQFHLGNALARFDRVGDLFEGVLKRPQRMEEALEKLSSTNRR